ncbi:MAG TPA: hypothetical protein VG937_09095 [Polyangiaceae bacterium]|nr:hypothetical protein [Polyangiaceae bacterium]
MRTGPFLVWVCLVTGISALACSGEDSPVGAATGGTGGTTNTGGTGGDEPDPRIPGQMEFERIRDGFESLETLAGSGVAGPDTNDWDPSFEGAPATDADLSTPHNALGDAEGNIFIADKDAHAIRKVAPDGTLTTVAGMNEAGDDGDEPAPALESHLNQPNGLWVKPDGTVYILDLGNTKVRRLDPDGTLSTLFADPTLKTGRGLWVADDESLAYMCSGTEVLRWDPEMGVTIFSQPFAELGNLYVDHEGIVFVTDRGANRIFRVERNGLASAIAGSGASSGPIDGQLPLEAPLNGVRGIWGAPTGGFFFGTHEGNQVLYQDSTGYFHVLIDGAHGIHTGDGEPLSSPGKKVSEVRNVTMTPEGALLITENDVGYIRIARPKP